jgi:Cdc6-like AAA superfamily ATPase
MEWLSPTDFSAQQHNIISRRQVGTGQWFLDSVEFRDWLQGQKKTLFCPGIPGAGKTMMAAIAIDHLHQTSSTLNIGLACIFCSYKAQTSQNVSNMFAALLKQLVHGRPDITAPVNRMYNDHSKLRSRPLLDEILQVLQSISTEYSTTYIIADALDEISDRDNERTRLIDKLLEFQRKSSVQLLFTSRPLPTITQKFTSTAKLEVRANADDVSRFVAGQMPRLPLCIQNNESLKCTVQRKIVETADGMYVRPLSWYRRDILTDLGFSSRGCTSTLFLIKEISGWCYLR